MAYFARRIGYGANDGDNGSSFLALIELAKKKGGTAIAFFLYRYVVYFDSKDREITMIPLEGPKNQEEAKAYLPWAKNSKFPGWKESYWQKTTGWLYAVGVGGGYGLFNEGTWVRVGMPSPWKNRRKKKPLEVGNNSHLLRISISLLASLKKQRDDIELQIGDLEVQEDEDGVISAHYFSEPNILGGYWYIEVENEKLFFKLKEQFEMLQQEVEELEMKVLNLTDELRFKFAKEKNVPYWRRDPELGHLVRPVDMVN